MTMASFAHTRPSLPSFGGPRAGELCVVILTGKLLAVPQPAAASTCTHLAAAAAWCCRVAKGRDLSGSLEAHVSVKLACCKRDSLETWGRLPTRPGLRDQYFSHPSQEESPGGV